MKIKFRITKKKHAAFVKIIRKTGKVLYWLIFTILILIAGTIAISDLKIPGNYKIFAVQSGSMEPAIKTASIVIIKPFNNYQKGDVITVQDPANPKNTLTHRIFEVKENNGSVSYITKGDANNAPDIEDRLKSNILGKVVFSVPLLGYPIGFAKTSSGLIILIIVPATIIIYSELVSIKNETKRLLKERKKRLSTKEKVEIEVGEEEIKIERWYKKIFKKIFKKNEN
jgi:signal peptidase